MPIPRLVSRLGLFLLLLAPLHAQPLPLRTWTDTQGRTIQARMTEGTETTVTVRRDDGRIFTLELEKLSTDDRDYVRKELEKRIPPPDLVLSLSRVQLDRQETGDKRDNLTRETEVSWGYSIGLENRGVQPVKDLRVEYVLFGRKDRAPGRADEKNAQLLRQSGRATIAEIGARQRHFAFE